MNQDLSTIRVLVADEMSPRAPEILRRAGFSVDVRMGLAPDELARVIGGYHGLAVRSATKVPAAAIERSAALRIIGRAGVGVDTIDVAAATARGVLVINTPAGNATAAAEMAVALLFSLARKVPRAAALMRQGVWDKATLMGVELTGKTLGVLGLGSIGREVAARGRGLQMSVIAHDPGVPSEAATALGVEPVSFDELLARADFLTLHVPLLDATKGLFGRGVLARMKAGACLVNVARGGIVDEAALLDALASGHLAGAGVDVFATEPPGLSPLLAHERVVATPHLGASTREAQEKVAIELAEVFVDYLRDGVVRNAVNKI